MVHVTLSMYNFRVIWDHFLYIDRFWDHIQAFWTMEHIGPFLYLDHLSTIFRPFLDYTRLNWRSNYVQVKLDRIESRTISDDFLSRPYFNIFKVIFINLHGFFFKIFHSYLLFSLVDLKLVLFRFFQLMLFYMLKQCTTSQHQLQLLLAVQPLSSPVLLVNFWVASG